MRPISRVRFNALAGYCRAPLPAVFQEFAWFEHANERVLGIVVRDRGDNDFGASVLGRDRRGRFRAIYTTGFESSSRRARVLLRREIERLALASDEEYYQGDEIGAPLDFFQPRVPKDRLDTKFLHLAEHPGENAARRIIEPMMHWYEDPDGNFIEQFQTTAFDARLWELYLFAAFREMGYAIDRAQAVPDFTCEGVLGQFAVEAATVNPTRDKTNTVVPPPSHDTPETLLEFQRHYMPIKFGSSLTSKLSKEYWKKPNVEGLPLLFAIQDFSAPASMTYTRAALPTYLYGYEHAWEKDSDGRLHVYPRKIATHRYGNKEIPSGFFFLPGAENVSAVIANTSATISKFNRMGVVAGFGSPRVHLVRQGFRLNHDPDATEPIPFVLRVDDPDYTETWVEGLDVYHNPRAKIPLDPEMLPGAAHYVLSPEGQIEHDAPDWHPLASRTDIYSAEEEPRTKSP